jgi:hypothetical protein
MHTFADKISLVQAPVAIGRACLKNQAALTTPPYISNL